jgi:2-oxoglutarate ferredoxin oxidoreductase subunit gamma
VVESQKQSRVEIRFSGSGGQGILLAAALVADALVESGKEVVQTQSYGPEARGGASKAEVIVSACEIDYPEVARPDVTLCLSQAAFDKYATETQAEGLVVFDEKLVRAEPIPEVRLVGVPFAELAQQELDRVVVANVIAVGALGELTGLTSPEALQEALRRRLPAKILELNLGALEVGRVAASALAMPIGA